jgi:hypothetical protein
VPEVVSFVGYQPPQRFDGLPWTDARIEEAATETGVYTQIDSLALTPVDTDPAAPAFRSFTTENGTALDYWYRVLFADADGDISQPTSPVQNTAGSDAPVGTGGPYVDISELQRVLGKTAPTAAELAAMERVLAAAAGEIDWDLGYSAANPAPPSDIVAAVNLERAAELWRFSYSTSGVLPQGPELGPVIAPRDTWHRHHLRLSPLRVHVGIA